ncbi:MAG: hypothetical protein QM634_15720 [Gordonia sp. (in: high G+C Gram-positive bacteria)]
MSEVVGETLLPTPRAARGASTTETAYALGGERIDDARTQGEVVLPTPAACNPNDGETPETWLARRDEVKARVGNGNGMGMPLSIAVQTLPTPKASDSKRSGCPSERARHTPDLGAVTHHFPTPNASDATGGWSSTASRIGHSNQVIDAVLDDDLWGKYGPAIRRWESITRPAPDPTEPNKNGRPRLSARFCEWMMGLPDGWVTDVPGLSRAEQLKALGNGVVPQQAATALRSLLVVAVSA